MAAAPRWSNGRVGAYKEVHTLPERQAEASSVRTRFPGRVPVIVEGARRSGSSVALPPLDKNKYLVPGDLTVGQFTYVVRKRMALAPEVAIFMFVDNKLPTASTLMRELYYMCSDVDGFLYITYAGESTFGGPRV